MLKLKIYCLWLLKKNKSSIQHYYKVVPVTFASGYKEQQISVEWWYEMALRYLGYGDGWCPEGMPKRMALKTKGIAWTYTDNHQEFYNKVISFLKARNSIIQSGSEGIYEPGLS